MCNPESEFELEPELEPELLLLLPPLPPPEPPPLPVSPDGVDRPPLGVDGRVDELVEGFDGLVCFNVGHLSFTGIVEPSGHFLVVGDGGLFLLLPFIPQVPLGNVRNL